MARRYIRRVSKVKNDDTKGYIINSTNVVDKEKNTYSAEIIDTTLYDLKMALGIGDTILRKRFSNKTNIDNIDLNGFAYLLDCTYGSSNTSIAYGYILQLTNGPDYKIQFFVSATNASGGIMWRRRRDGVWDAWKTITST